MSLKKISFLLLTLVMYKLCSAQIYPRYFYSEETANTTEIIKRNKVRLEHIYSYTIETNILKSMLIIDSSLLYTCTYDDQGRPLIRQKITGRSVLKDSSVYDPSGERVTVFLFSVFNGVQHPLAKDEYMYNKAGQKINWTSHIYTKDTVDIHGARYLYDSKQQLIEEQSTRHDTITGIITHEYNNEGSRIRSLHKRSNGKLFLTRVYEYNYRKKKISKMTLYSLYPYPLGKIENYMKEYDAEGRCTLLFHNNSLPVKTDLFKYSLPGLFFERREVQSGYVKKLERHYYFTD